MAGGGKWWHIRCHLSGRGVKPLPLQAPCFWAAQSWGIWWASLGHWETASLSEEPGEVQGRHSECSYWRQCRFWEGSYRISPSGCKWFCSTIIQASEELPPLFCFYPLDHEMHWSFFCAFLFSFLQWKTGIASISALWLSQLKSTYTHIFRYLYHLLVPLTGRAIWDKSFTINLIHNSTLVVLLAIGYNSHDWVSLPSPAPE